MNCQISKSKYNPNKHIIMDKLTLLSLFEQSEAELRAQLSDLVLPRDAKKLNRILSDLFVDHIKVGEYKQELTNSEIAIFQSAILLVEESLQLQQNLFAVKAKEETLVAKGTTQSKERKLPINKSQVAIVAVAATGILTGAVTNIGTILLATVATAAGVWIAREGNEPKTKVKEKVIKQELAINADAIIETTKKICQSLDNIMGVYQTNIENLRSRIENKPEPTLYNSYGYLLNRLSYLYKDMTNNANIEEVKEDIAKLFKTLKNYNYEFVNYSEATKQFFEVEELEEISELEVEEVAILEKGECIVKGKIYQPKNK